MSRLVLRVLIGCLAAGIAACDSPAEPRRETGVSAADPPRVVAVGTVQDGGLPHAACSCTHCEAARHDPERARRIASLALVLPGSPQVYLIDATPDVREQLEEVRRLKRGTQGRVDRSPVDGVLLTHAHLGHYTGLAFFGFEAVHTRNLPVFCSPSMAEYLRQNGPWSQLVRLGNIALHEVVADETFRLGEAVEVTPFRVPHRDEYATTYGFILRGPTSNLLYVPDTDGWDSWQPSLIERLDGIDVAILDGSFYSPEELPGRSVSSIGHPLIVDSMELLGPLVRSGRTRVYFTHLNHSNPALDPRGPQRSEMQRRGFHVLAEGQQFPL